MSGKRPRVGASANAPAAPLTSSQHRSVAMDKRQKGANPPPARHRMAGSHDGMYVTEHHRGAKRKG